MSYVPAELLSFFVAVGAIFFHCPLGDPSINSFVGGTLASLHCTVSSIQSTSGSSTPGNSEVSSRSTGAHPSAAEEGTLAEGRLLHNPMSNTATRRLTNGKKLSNRKQRSAALRPDRDACMSVAAGRGSQRGVAGRPPCWIFQSGTHLRPPEHSTLNLEQKLTVNTPLLIVGHFYFSILHIVHTFGNM